MMSSRIPKATRPTAQGTIIKPIFIATEEKFVKNGGRIKYNLIIKYYFNLIFLYRNNRGEGGIF